MLAVAFDLGTTTIAASLLDMATGERLASAGGLNPQRVFGADVVSRLDAALKSAPNLGKLSALVNGALAGLAEELLGAVGADAGDLIGVAIAGNPAMEHLLLGLPVECLAFPPYRPRFTAGRAVSTREFGWDMARPAYVFPLPGGFVGGDLVAFLYGREVSGPRSPVPGPRLFLDLGTNGEIALTRGERIYATSAAAGPAFEGGNLSCGMAALPGAISGVSLGDGRVTVTTVDGTAPLGICGSAVIEVVAGLLREGIVDNSGRLLSPGEIPTNLANRVEEIGGEPAFVLYRDAERTVSLTQGDIRQVQVAKAAIRAGMEVVFERSGTGCDDLEEVVLTGSFGAVLTPESLKNIGIFSEKMVEKARFVREGALAGVEKSLRAPRGFEEVDRLATAITVVPLSGNPAFEKHFIAQMNFPHVSAP